MQCNDDIRIYRQQQFQLEATKTKFQVVCDVYSNVFAIVCKDSTTTLSSLCDVTDICVSHQIG